MSKNLKIFKTMTVKKQTTKPVLLKLKIEVHKELMKNSKLQKRSMQQIVEKLVENWIADGSPDPYGICNSSSESQPISNTVIMQHAARLVKLEESFERMHKHLSGFH